MQLYNTLSRKKEKFKPLKDKSIGMYACGPTVYSAPHIGNFRAYLGQDVLKRALAYEGYKVNHVLNITDVGHLVGDANLGEDKVKLAAEREHKTARQVADFYTGEFEKDLKRLNIIHPNITPKATDHIKQMLELIEALDKKGYLYKAPTGIYFDTSKFKEYGKLAKMNFEKLNKYLKAGARVERAAGLKNITDFAVWRFRKKESKDDMVWDSKWGEGFPGWHIECSAMSMEYLGETFDIHCGGVDHIPIHHTNEIAQSEAATGKKFVHYWVHNNFLTVDGGKMAKSIGNVYTIEDLIAKGFSPLAVRYLLISAHYRKKLNFTIQALDNVQKTLNSLYKFLKEISTDYAKPGKIDPNFKLLVEEKQKEFFKQIQNDLNIPAALSVMFGLIGEANKRRFEEDNLNKNEAQLVLQVMLEFDKILGLEFEKNKTKHDVNDQINALLNERNDARKAGLYSKADQLRNELREKYHIIVEDTKDGQKWHREI